MDPQQPARLKAADKAARAFELRIAGYDYSFIAKDLGMKNGSAVYAMIQRELDRRVGPPKEEYRQLELARLEDIWKPLFRYLKEKDAEGKVPNLKLVDRLIHVVEMQSKLAGIVPYKLGEQTQQVDVQVELSAEAKKQALLELYERLRERLEMGEAPQGIPVALPPEPAQDAVIIVEPTSATAIVPSDN